MCSFFVYMKTKVVRKFICSIVPRLCLVKQIGDVCSMWVCYSVFRKHRKWMYEESGTEYNVKISSGVVENKTIFVFWRQGFENAPDVVKKCILSLRKNLGEYALVLLDEKNLHEYVNLPEYIVNLKTRGLIGEPQYSDLIRTNLLIRYGGVWCDATCFWQEKIPSSVESSTMFVFKTVLLKENCSPIKCSNWFIKAERNNLILRRLQNFLFEYYKYYSQPIHYFIYHIALSMIVDCDENCRKIWDGIPYVCNMNPHVFMYSFALPFDDYRYQSILRTSFVHKLTYKISNSVRSDSSNILNHFLKC